MPPPTAGAPCGARLFRADGLHRLTEADIATLEPLGLRTVIDLRSAPELDERGRFPVDSHPVVFHHLPIIDATWAAADRPNYDRDEDFLIWAYQEMLTIGAPRFAAAFEALAEPGALPAVFHCAAGKDRTGLLAALVLGSLGVSDDDIVADYTLTVEGMVRFRAWARSRVARDGRNAWPRCRRRSPRPSPTRCATSSTSCRAEHGSIRNYVQSIGVQ